MTRENEFTITVDQLQVGVYVYLDVGWMSHPFSFNNFKIRSEDQIATIRQLGLKSVRWDPDRSDIKPLQPGQKAAPASVPPIPAPVAAASVATTSATVTPAAATDAMEPSPPPAPDADIAIPAAIEPVIAAKQERSKRLAAHRQKIAHVESEFLGAASVVRAINKNLYAQPEQTLAETGQLVQRMVDALLAAPDLAIQVMSEKPGEDVYLHSLNVSILAMILARELGLPAELVRLVGIGALFHDIGKTQVPARIVGGTGQMTKAERDFLELHCQYGLDIGKHAGLPPPTLNIIYQHHENFDGSGYPARLKGEAIDPLARIVAVVNAYDMLCNPINVAHALTPHEALSQMFAQYRNRYDPKLLQLFIRFMGVYPPGTVVRLSNEVLGLIIAVNSARPLKPTVVVYDSAVPKHEAIILDLEQETDINISKAIRPSQLPAAVFDYLSPRRRVSYYFDPGYGPAGAP